MIENKPVKDQFKMWHYAMERPYDLNSIEGLNRYSIFKKNLKLIKSTNEKNLGYTLGLGPFTDLTSEEFKNAYLYNNQEVQENNRKSIRSGKNLKEFDVEELATSTDHSHIFKNIKQANCKDHALVDISNALHAQAVLLKKGAEFENGFSSQYWIDCSNSSICDSPTTVCKCEYNSIANSLNYITQKLGAPIEKDYPYKVKDIEYVSKCTFDNSKPRYSFKKVEFCYHGFQEVLSGKNCHVDQINDFIEKGPYLTQFYADQKIFPHYSKGLYQQDNCSNYPNTSGLVTFVSKEKVKVLLSLGSKFGENGFINFKVVKGNHQDDEFNVRRTGCGVFDFVHSVTGLEKK